MRSPYGHRQLTIDVISVLVNSAALNCIVGSMSPACIVYTSFVGTLACTALPPSAVFDANFESWMLPE